MMMQSNEEQLFEDNRSLDEIIQEVADEQGLSFEETLKLYKKGLKEALGYSNSKSTAKQKEKTKKKRKMAKASKKRNR